jgi:hypothetical protein
MVAHCKAGGKAFDGVSGVDVSRHSKRHLCYKVQRVLGRIVLSCWLVGFQRSFNIHLGS